MMGYNMTSGTELECRSEERCRKLETPGEGNYGKINEQVRKLVNYKTNPMASTGIFRKKKSTERPIWRRLLTISALEFSPDSPLKTRHFNRLLSEKGRKCLEN